MAARSGSFAPLAAGALLLGVAGLALAAAPAAGQEVESPFRFLRGRDIPLPTPQLLPESQPPDAADPLPDDEIPLSAEEIAEPGDPLPQGPPAGGPEDLTGSVEPPGEGDPADAMPVPTETIVEIPAPAAPTETIVEVPAPVPPETALAPGEAGALPGGPGDSGSALESPAAPEDAPKPADSAPAAGPDDRAEQREEARNPGETVSSYSLRAFRLGVLAGRDVRVTMAALQPVAEGLQEALGRPVEFFPMSSYRAMIDSQESQRIDGGFYSAAAYALAEAHCRCLEPIVAPAAADGTVAYYAVVVAASDSGIATLADLSGKTVATGAADSIGGRRMQIAALASEGFDLSVAVATFVETASASDAVRLVAEGEADAAFAWSSLEGDLETGYSRGTLADLVASGGIAMDEIAVIWRSPAIAHGPVAVAKAVPDEDKRRIETYLIGLDAALPAAYDMLNPFYPGGYVGVEPDDYRGFDALAAVDVDAVRLPGNQPAEAVD